MMKLIVPLFVFFVAFGVSLNAQDKQSAVKRESAKKEMKTGAESTAEKQAADNGKPFNTVCPVSGEDLDADAKLYTYNGKTYGVCCNKCLAKIRKDPEKYISRLSDDGKTIKKNKI